MSPTKKEIQRAARLDGVVDVTLLGTASLEYWTNQLESEALEPIDASGSAQIMIDRKTYERSLLW